MGDDMTRRLIADEVDRNGVCRCGYRVLDQDWYAFRAGGTVRACCKGCVIASEDAGRHVVVKRERVRDD